MIYLSSVKIWKLSCAVVQHMDSQIAHLSDQPTGTHRLSKREMEGLAPRRMRWIVSQERLSDGRVWPFVDTHRGNKYEKRLKMMGIMLCC